MITTTLAYIPSPSRGVWHLGTLSALVIIAGIIAAFVCGSRLRDARKHERGAIYDIAAWAAPAVVIGLHYLRRVEAERQSQEKLTDQEADEARVSAPDIV